MEGDGVGHFLLALFAQPVDNPPRMFIGPLFVVGVVQESGDGPNVGVGVVAAVFGSRRPHHDFDRPGMFQQRLRLGPGVQLGYACWWVMVAMIWPLFGETPLNLVALW